MEIFGAMAQESAGQKRWQRQQNPGLAHVLTALETHGDSTRQQSHAGHHPIQHVGRGHTHGGRGVLGTALAFARRCRRSLCPAQLLAALWMAFVFFFFNGFFKRPSATALRNTS